MKLSLSTNWCNRTIENGEEIADLALRLGFDELELGFHTTSLQVDGFKKRLDEIPVSSIHAFCPVPVSAPQGYPELYTIVSKDEDARSLARYHIEKNISFASEIGAKTIVLHLGRIHFSTFFNRSFDSGALRETLQNAKGDTNDKNYQKLLSKALKTRKKRSEKMMGIVIEELEKLFPSLEKYNVTLALENLPYLEGFPNEREMKMLLEKFNGAPLRAWFDTGHNKVREMHDWISKENENRITLGDDQIIGMHLNDVIDFNDDHLAPGNGNVDFASLAHLAKKVRHVVFEPHSHVSEDELKKGIEFIKKEFRL